MTDTQAAFGEIAAQFSPAVQASAWATRQLIYEVLPVVVEVAWPRQKIVGYGTGPKKMSEQFAYISLHKQHINLGFYYGSELPDPEKLLEGSGKLLRHIKIRSPEDLERPGLRALLEFARSYRVPPPKET